ncbi:MAG: hypothetical protein K8I04_09755 [Gammaproteobacteria bacterium]|nr:hypothetical protein [Gammaproteobacteria bacterium]
MRDALPTAGEQGRADAWDVYADQLKRMGERKLTSGDVFGTRKFLNNNYLYRWIESPGIYSNSKQEAMYDGKSQLLIKDPINRCPINLPMLTDMKKNTAGSLTL